MKTHILGYPRIGSKRELKHACEKYWSGRISKDELLEEGRKIRESNWRAQLDAGLDFSPVNDFSFYDQVLDMIVMIGAVPGRYQEIIDKDSKAPGLDVYFAMARGKQENGIDIPAMEMTKWFDTNYHYIVPEFVQDQKFQLNAEKILSELEETKKLGVNPKPVIIGPVSMLLLGKEKENDFDKLELLSELLPVYRKLIHKLRENGIEWIQVDEPYLVTDLSEEEKEAYRSSYSELTKELDGIKLMLTTYFDDVSKNIDLVSSLPSHGLHIDLSRAPDQLDVILGKWPKEKCLSLGVVNGRNIWKNNIENSLALIKNASGQWDDDKLFIATSCSLLHVPYDLRLEKKLSSEIRDWLSFAQQKLQEVVFLKQAFLDPGKVQEELDANKTSIQSRLESKVIHQPKVRDRVAKLTSDDYKRGSEFAIRKKLQKEMLGLPMFPTTTIGSFPQTKEVRKWRSRFKRNKVSVEAYEKFILEETKQAIRKQENIGLDVLVHGEFERNDMVEYFGEQLDGFTFTRYAWVQSYGSRCVKPPIIFGDISRPKPMTVDWTTKAQNMTDRPVKGMLTGPVTILQWSFVRDDQPRSETATQIALAIRDEVSDLESAGVKIIQVDEPALREGLPLSKENRKQYLDWAIDCFRLATSSVKDETQIHTHMCYSEFNDIIEHIALMDADVITIECSRSQMELLDAFIQFRYPNDIGPGVYDIHSPRVPSIKEVTVLLEKALEVLAPDQLWVNPDCGLKTRKWEETEKSLLAMVDAANEVRNRGSV